MNLHETTKRNSTSSPGIFIGVVEDNKDPLKQGRVRVRVIGLHSENKSPSNTDGIPTADLPWAIPGNPIFEGSNSGYGFFSVPIQGSMVALFFIGDDHNYPCYFASIPAYPKEKRSASKGFSDPDGKYPDKTGEPDWNRDARNEGETTNKTKNANRETGISQVKSGTWVEPTSPYASVYPNNSVFATRDKGMVVEYDSTPGAERYHIYHVKSGNYFEISESGQTVLKSKDNHYEINIKDKNILIKQNKNESIVGNEDRKIDGNKDALIDGSDTETISGNKIENITGELTITVVGSCKVTANTINLDGGSGAVAGIVQGQCFCSITGAPHPNISRNVKGSF